MSHSDVVWKPHLCNLLLAAIWDTGLCSTGAHRRERIMGLRNHSYLWAPVSKWHNYPCPLTAISYPSTSPRLCKSQPCRSFYAETVGRTLLFIRLGGHEYCLLHAKLIFQTTCHNQAWGLSLHPIIHQDSCGLDYSEPLSSPNEPLWSTFLNLNQYRNWRHGWRFWRASNLPTFYYLTVTGLVSSSSVYVGFRRGMEEILCFWGWGAYFHIK